MVIANETANLTRTLQRHLLRVEAGAIGGLIGAVAVALFFFVQPISLAAHAASVQLRLRHLRRIDPSRG